MKSANDENHEFFCFLNDMLSEEFLLEQIKIQENHYNSDRNEINLSLLDNRLYVHSEGNTAYIYGNGRHNEILYRFRGNVEGTLKNIIRSKNRVYHIAGWNLEYDFQLVGGDGFKYRFLLIRDEPDIEVPKINSRTKRCCFFYKK